MTNQLSNIVRVGGYTLPELQSQLDYTNKVLNSGFNFEQWEKKEYMQLKTDLEQSVNRAKEIIRDYA